MSAIIGVFPVKNFLFSLLSSRGDEVNFYVFNLRNTISTVNYYHRPGIAMVE